MAISSLGNRGGMGDRRTISTMNSSKRSSMRSLNITNMCNRDSMCNRGSSISSMRDMGSLNWLTGSLGKLVVDIGTCDLGHNVALLNLNWDVLGFGVVHAVLGLDFTASMLDGFSDRVGNSVGSNWSKMNRGNSNLCNLDMGNSNLSNMNRGGSNMCNMGQ